YAATHLSIETGTGDRISRDLPCRQRDVDLDRACPQNVGELAVVIDGATAGQAEDAATALAQWARGHPELFKSVQEPGGGAFFKREGLLLLPTADVQKVTEQLIAAQPMLGALAADPSLRGLFSSLSLAATGVEHGDIDLSEIEAPLNAIAGAVNAALAGSPRHLSWGSLFTGRQPDPQEL